MLLGFNIIAAVVGFLTFPAVFWTLMALEVIGLIIATEKESAIGAFFAMAFMGGLGLLEFGTVAGLMAFIKANTLLMVAGFFGYFVIGTLWSRFKWGLFVGDKAQAINDHIAKFGVDNAVDAYATRVNRSYAYGEKYEFNHQEIRDTNFACLAPKVMEYKKKITTWIILWVPSLAYFILNDPMRRIANFIFDEIKGHFQAASDRIFKKSFKVIIPAPKEKVEEK